jgi:hypothetical protein
VSKTVDLTVHVHNGTKNGVFMNELKITISSDGADVVLDMTVVQQPRLGRCATWNHAVAGSEREGLAYKTSVTVSLSAANDRTIPVGTIPALGTVLAAVVLVKLDSIQETAVTA